ncbi:transketolase family protein [Candidatus Peregrinibacteria bacterium]|nr:transketolase family protein [Candidatus Peregrinibacteria bacterium]
MSNFFSLHQAFRDSLLKLGAEHKNVVLFDSDCSRLSGTDVFRRQFPDRHFNMGHSMALAAGMAAGFSLRRKIVFLSGTSVFITGKVYESIRNLFCLSYLNVKIVAIASGFSSGKEGAVHQSIDDIALMRLIPNMKVVCPADYFECVSVFKAAVSDFGPTYIRLHSMELPVLYDETHRFFFGKSTILKQGKDITLFATGSMVVPSLEAASFLQKNGISVRVVNISSIKPLDEKLIFDCAKISKFVVTVEEHSIIGGLGSAVAEVLSGHSPFFVYRIGIEDTFGESGDTEDLYEKYGLNAKGIFKRIQGWLENL